MDEIEDNEGVVRLLYVVPITPYERHLLVEHGRASFLDYVKREAIDLLSDRRDESKWYNGTE